MRALEDHHAGLVPPADRLLGDAVLRQLECELRKFHRTVFSFDVILFKYVSRRKKVSHEMADQVGHDEKTVIPGMIFPSFRA